MKIVTPLLLFLWLFKTACYEKLLSSPLFKLVEDTLNIQHYSAPQATIDELQQSIIKQQQQIESFSAELDKYEGNISAIPNKFPRAFTSIGELSRHPTTSEPLKRKATHATDRLRYEMQIFDHVLSAHHDTLTEALCYQHKFKIDCTSATSEASQLVSAILKDVPSDAPTSSIPAIDKLVVTKIDEKFDQLRRPHWMVCILSRAQQALTHSTAITLQVRKPYARCRISAGTIRYTWAWNRSQIRCSVAIIKKQDHSS